MTRYKYWTPSGYVETDNVELAQEMSAKYFHPYIMGTVHSQGRMGVWIWSFVNTYEFPLEVSRSLGWNQF